jgi:hypothetical protein
LGGVKLILNNNQKTMLESSLRQSYARWEHMPPSSIKERTGLEFIAVAEFMERHQAGILPDVYSKCYDRVMEYLKRYGG